MPPASTPTTQPVYRPLLARPLLALVVLLIAAGTAFWSYQRTSRNVAALATCEATGAQDWAGALAASEGLVGDADAIYGEAIEGLSCRCSALVATERGGECASMMAEVLGGGGGGLESGAQLPDRALVAFLVHTWQADGNAALAGELARAAHAQSPDDAGLLRLALQTGAGLSGGGLSGGGLSGGGLSAEGQMLEAATRRVAGRPPKDAAKMRLVLGAWRVKRQEYSQATEVLAGIPEEALLGADFIEDVLVQRMLAYAGAGDIPAMRANVAAFPTHGLPQTLGEAYYAVGLSTNWLVDPDQAQIPLMLGVLAREAEITNPTLHEFLYERLITHLVLDRRYPEALAIYDRGHATFGMPLVDRAEIQRLADGGTAEGGPGGLLRFEGVPSGGSVRLSPEASAPPDTPYVVIPAGGATRHPAPTPQRWVATDAEGRPVASGSAWPKAGEAVVVQVHPGAAVARSELGAPPKAADGRRRVWVVILDCADWRLVSYLRERGELPNLTAAMDTGWRAVLVQEPAFTAAAMQTLSFPAPETAVSMVGYLHGFGMELAGLASIGNNPAEPLAALLPGRTGLFAGLAGGGRSVANLLFSHADQHAGRNASIYGPGAATREVPFRTAQRPLSADEQRRFPGFGAIAAKGYGQNEVERLAATFDATLSLVADPAVDAIFVRVADSDLLTHAFYAQTATGEQDDGAAILHETYRYMDWRLAELRAAIDADDRLVIMSDHGISVAMEHDPHALFLVTGAGVPVGRAAGEPALVGVSRFVADQLGVHTEWPDTHVGWGPEPG